MATPSDLEVFSDASASPLPAEQGLLAPTTDYNEALKLLLSKIPVSSFEDEPGGGLGVVDIPSDMKVKDALEVLHQNKAMYAAVLDKANNQPNQLFSSSTFSDRYLGLLELPRLILWCLQQELDKEKQELEEAEKLAVDSATGESIRQENLSEGPVTTEWSGWDWLQKGSQVEVLASTANMLESEDKKEKELRRQSTKRAEEMGFMEMVGSMEDLAETDVGCVSCQAHWSPFLPLHLSASLLDAMSSMSCHNLKATPVLSGQDSHQPNLKGFITQSTVLSALSQCRGLSAFDTLVGNRSLTELGLPGQSSRGSLRPGDLLLERLSEVADIEGETIVVLEEGQDRLIGTVQLEDLVLFMEDKELFSKRRELTAQGFIEAKERSRAKSLQPSKTRSPAKESDGLSELSDGPEVSQSSGFLPAPDPFHCCQDASLSEVIQAMVTANSDRGLVVSQESRTEAQSSYDKLGSSLADMQLADGPKAAQQPTLDDQGVSRQIKSSEPSVCVLGVVTAKDVIRKSIPPVTEPAVSWGGFFENVVTQASEGQADMISFGLTSGIT